MVYLVESETTCEGASLRDCLLQGVYTIVVWERCGTRRKDHTRKIEGRQGTYSFPRKSRPLSPHSPTLFINNTTAIPILCFLVTPQFSLMMIMERILSTKMGRHKDAHNELFIKEGHCSFLLSIVGLVKDRVFKGPLFIMTHLPLNNADPSNLENETVQNIL